MMPFLKFMILASFPFLLWFVFSLCMTIGQFGSDSVPREIGPHTIMAYLMMAPAIYSLLAANIFIALGCIRVSQLRNYKLAWITMVVAALPCINPLTTVPAIVVM